MKRYLFYLLSFLLMAIAPIVGCKPPEDKVVIQIMPIALPAQNIKVVKERDWASYRAGIWSTIRSNNSLLIKLKVKVKLQRGPIDATYVQYPCALDDRNTALETKMYVYDSDVYEWSQNKLSYMQEIKELGADIIAFKQEKEKFQSSL